MADLIMMRVLVERFVPPMAAAALDGVISTLGRLPSLPAVAANASGNKTMRRSRCLRRESRLPRRNTTVQAAAFPGGLPPPENAA